MLKVGSVQIPNSTELEENFLYIQKCLDFYTSHKVDILLFPECSLSGFSSKIGLATIEKLTPYLNQIQNWSTEINTAVIIPTALNQDGKNFNTGFIFYRNQKEQFYKLGLTESEKLFFTTPENPGKKIFRINETNVAILICIEIELAPWTYFNDDHVDLILWPSYWGRDLERDRWDEKSVIYQNMQKWNRPLIQSNFSKNAFNQSMGNGPSGLNLFLNSNNTVIALGPYQQNASAIIEISQNEIQKINIAILD